MSAINILRLSTLNSHTLRSLTSSVSSLHASSSTTNGSMLDTKPLEAVALNAQNLAFNILTVPLKKQLVTVGTLPIWTNRATSSSPFGISVPQFSLSPSPYATRIGEHLLALPQQIELYQDDEALKYSISSLPFYNDSMDGEVNAALVWMTCVVRAAADSFSNSILSIERISTHGMQQLKEDVGYMINVFAAMEVKPNVTLENIRKGVDGILEYENLMSITVKY